MKKTFLLVFLLSLSLLAVQNSKAYTQAYLNELQTSKDIFLAQEAGRAADKKIPNNIFTQIFNISKFQGKKKIIVGKHLLRCTNKVIFKTAIKGKNKINLFALCTKKISNTSYLIYQGFSTSLSKRVELILTSVLIEKKHMIFWLNHFNVNKEHRNFLLK